MKKKRQNKSSKYIFNSVSSGVVHNPLYILRNWGILKQAQNDGRVEDKIRAKRIPPNGGLKIIL
jgi:hypothetical protein